ncbi:MAG: glycosyltransferase family 2 protein [Eggerthellaceae bacterium]|jgi:glycosyltransferase involved in cell wall biosynthesis|nr:glycosyltransferase family 2 protein [Eggerthellaceae bacterium]
MDPVVVIPTFFSGKRRARRNSSVTGVYDHATDVDAQGELDRCLASLESVDNLGLVMVLVSAENGIEDRAEEKVQAAVDAHPDLNVMVIGRNELGLVRKRMEALGLPALNHEVSLQGYGAVRNLGLLLAGVLGFDAVVFLDDDEVIEDPGFLKAAMYGLGKHTKKGFPILAKTGFYLNEQGSYRSSWEDQWYDRFWKQASAFNEWIEKAMRAPRLSRSNHVCGGVLALHKEVFKRIPFDAWIARGEDLDYMINLRLYGSDVWFDNRWVLRHLPPATTSEGNRFRQDIFRWLYEYSKLEYSRALIDLQPVRAASLEPYPGPFLRPGLAKRIRTTAFLRSLGRSDKKGYRAAARSATGEAVEYASRNCSKYFDFQSSWADAMARLEGDEELSSELFRAYLQRMGATPEQMAEFEAEEAAPLSDADAAAAAAQVAAQAIAAAAAEAAASLEAAQKAERAQRRRSRQDIHPHASIDPGMTSEIRLNIAE